ncbi:CPBP family intramembrane metalloprotease [bacterium]|nr:CPBP family intramembrane metalloprotease [bacterium]
MKISKRSAVAAAGYVLLYALSIAILASSPGFNAGESLAVFLIFGVGFSIAAWLSTIGVEPARVEVQRPGSEFIAVFFYLLIFAILILGWGLSAVKDSIPREPAQSVAILLVKLITMVAVPAFILKAFGYSLLDLFRVERLGKAGWRASLLMTVLLFLLQAFLGRGLQSLSALDAPGSLILLFAPIALLWMCLEAGLAEEFLFRVFLQTRSSAWLRSETAGIVVMALIFGLAHAPGYVLRGQHFDRRHGKGARYSHGCCVFHCSGLANRADVRCSLDAHTEFVAACFSSRMDRSAPQSRGIYQELDR